MKPYLRFETGGEPTAAGKILCDWHRDLAENDRGGRAELRRARSPEEVAFVRAFHRLLHRLEPDYSVWRPGLASVVGLAARVEGHASGASVPKQMGAPEPGKEQPRVSELRFRRLLAITPEEPDQLFQQLGRLVALLGSRVNLLSLADSVYRWNDRTRRDWAYDYYQAAPERT